MKGSALFVTQCASSLLSTYYKKIEDDISLWGISLTLSVMLHRQEITK